jgi:hypothetical protein
MQQQIISVTGNASGSVKPSSLLPMNLNATPFNIGFGVVVSGTTTTTTYYIQHTFDNPQTVSSPTWFYHPSTPSGTPATTTALLDGNYAFPVAAIRILANGTNTSTITMTVIQAGIA